MKMSKGKISLILPEEIKFLQVWPIFSHAKWILSDDQVNPQRMQLIRTVLVRENLQCFSQLQLDWSDVGLQTKFSFFIFYTSCLLLFTNEIGMPVIFSKGFVTSGRPPNRKVDRRLVHSNPRPSSWDATKLTNWPRPVSRISKRNQTNQIPVGRTRASATNHAFTRTADNVVLSQPILLWAFPMLFGGYTILSHGQYLQMICQWTNYEGVGHVWQPNTLPFVRSFLWKLATGRLTFSVQQMGNPRNFFTKLLKTKEWHVWTTQLRGQISKQMLVEGSKSRAH